MSSLLPFTICARKSTPSCLVLTNVTPLRYLDKNFASLLTAAHEPRFKYIV